VLLGEVSSAWQEREQQVLRLEVVLVSVSLERLELQRPGVVQLAQGLLPLVREQPVLAKVSLGPGQQQRPPLQVRVWQSPSQPGRIAPWKLGSLRFYPLQG
jgi:hypothetical protein